MYAFTIGVVVLSGLMWWVWARRPVTGTGSTTTVSCSGTRTRSISLSVPVELDVASVRRRLCAISDLTALSPYVVHMRPVSDACYDCRMVLSFSRQLYANVRLTFKHVDSDTITIESTGSRLLSFKILVSLRTQEGASVVDVWIDVWGIASFVPLPFLDHKMRKHADNLSLFVAKIFAKPFDPSERLAPFLCRVRTFLARHDSHPFLEGHIDDLLRHSTTGGKMQRARLAFMTFDAFSTSPSDDITTMGGVLELLQAFAIISDDIMDDSSTRRGKPCWHVIKGTGLALNDGLILLTLCYELINHHVADDVRTKLRSCCDEVILSTTLGQSMDALSEGMSVDHFTEERYAAIVTYKTALYTFWLPFACGIIAARLDAEYETALLQLTRRLSVHLGHFFQRQDDFLDCYGDPSVTGKIGTDIKDGKCTWLAVHAMTHGTDAQKTIMREHYGRADPKHVARVKGVYDELDIPAVYKHDEEQRVATLKAQVASSDSKIRSLAMSILGQLYRRTV